MEERLAAFGLHVAPEKTAIRRFDGSLLQGRKGRAQRPETFTFLGFTHYWRKSLSGYIHVARKPSVKTRERFLREVTTWLQANQHVRVWVQQAHLTRMLRGFYQYFGIRVGGRPLFNKRAAWRGEMRSVIPRRTISSSNSRWLH
jgi:RNA-directed DNA polymerase